ncbi:MAG: HlyC/CorC family transporter [Clostridia bacterium]|nr:HlyC/CorC family transporter [Clostridia bacterium]
MTGDSDGFIWIAPICTADNGNVVWVGILLLIIFFGFCFFFSFCAGAIASATVGSMKRQADEGSEAAKKALGIISQEIKYIRRANAGFAFNLAAAVILCEFLFAGGLAKTLSAVIADDRADTIISAVLILVFALWLGLSFGRIIPEKAGSASADQSLPKTAAVFRAVCWLLTPISVISQLISNVALKILGYNGTKDSEQLTEEEILMMVDEGEESGLIEGNTKDMIENVFDFDDTSVGEIMTHRKDVVAVRDDAKITDVAQTAIRSGKSRIPVYHDDIDDIAGIIHVKDLLKYISTNAPTEQIGSDMIKEAVFVPESKRCSEMFEYMTAHKTQIAVVVDEFGGTGGIVTMEDLVESIVGSIQDEYDNEDEEIKRLDENSFTVDGAASLDEIAELTGLNFDGDDNDTLAGIMLDRMGHIPKNGEHPSIVINGTRFTVQEVDNRRISKVLIVRSRRQH